jgi:uncharacterized protein YlxP (DUF503 family)
MHLISLCVRLQLKEPSTIGQKRKRAQAVVAKLRESFNASIVELARNDQVGELVLGAAVLARNRREAHDLADRILDALACLPGSAILDTPLINDH